jgi:hypothetical protein
MVRADHGEGRRWRGETKAGERGEEGALQSAAASPWLPFKTN